MKTRKELDFSDYGKNILPIERLKIKNKDYEKCNKRV